MYMPYDSVPHAGGRALNYYIKTVAENATVRLLSLATRTEVQKSTIQLYGIEPDYIVYDEIAHKTLKKIASLNSKFNPFHKYGNLIVEYKANALLARLKNYKKNNYVPSTIVLQWTEIIMLIDEIKKIFPTSRVIAVEEDVTYLRLMRESSRSKGSLSRGIKTIKYINEKRRELKALQAANYICVYNEKDKKLLCQDKLSPNKIFVLSPVFSQYCSTRCCNHKKHDMLFYGNMGRPENYDAVIRFITNVFPKIPYEDKRLYVVGGNPEHIEKYRSKNVIITGYIENPEWYFSSCNIFVAPIYMGAGIKIKIVEAMASGIPVITTDIGIEGIPAMDKKDYIAFKTDEDLVRLIDYYFTHVDELEKIGNQGKIRIEETFDMKRVTQDYSKLVVGE